MRLRPNFKRSSITEDGDPSSPMYPLAHLGLARTAVLAGDVTKRVVPIRISLWFGKDADSDLPILIEAKKEYEKLEQ